MLVLYSNVREAFVETPTVPTPETTKLVVLPIETNSLLNFLSENTFNWYPSKDVSVKSNTKLLFSTDKIWGLINDIDWLEPPVLAILTTVGGEDKQSL